MYHRKLRKNIKVSFVATVLNEEETIKGLLDSIIQQTKKPDEVIVVDGGSTDRTLSEISNIKLKFRVLTKHGNRSVGRNAGIKRATGDIILLSDAGCTLDKNWVKNIIQPFDNHSVDVVAGYYKAKPKTVFEKCLVPYVFVMPDKVNPKTFLPASRSMAFRKGVWKKVGGFPQEFSHNEDYVFANRLKKMNAAMVFKRDAIVYWQPRTNLKQAFIMFFRFALGDAEAGIYRPKAVLTVLRYFFTLLLAAIIFMLQSIQAAYLLVGLTLLYVFWSIIKNFRYVHDIRALYWLPLLQLTSDIAVSAGMVVGYLLFFIEQIKTQPKRRLRG